MGQKEGNLQILQDEKLGLGCGWVFQRDSDPEHKSKVFIERLNQATIKVLERPSQSPDLNALREHMDKETSPCQKANQFY